MSQWSATTKHIDFRPGKQSVDTTANVSPQDLASDKNDKDIGRVAAFCIDPTRKPPELGSIAHFLQIGLDQIGFCVPTAFLAR
jgi:hypothetical protein